MRRHALRETVIRNGQQGIKEARIAQRAILEEIVNADTDIEAPMKLAILRNQIAQSAFDANEDVPIVLIDAEKTQLSNEYRTWRERVANFVICTGMYIHLMGNALGD